MDVIIADVIGEVALVLFVSSLLGAVAARLGQPRVVGQIVAGIVLGPTVLGHLPGHLASRLFPEATLSAMTILANVAVVVFMFVVGYELDFSSLQGVRRAAPMVAGAALLVPMALTIGTVFLFRAGFQFAGAPHHLTWSFLLFMGVALSITAMPVLASIVRDRGIAGTTAGNIATAAAGIMDVLAWLVLAAALVGTAHAPVRPFILTVFLLVAFTAAMLLVIRPVLRALIRRTEFLLSSPTPVALALALGGAWVTATLGLHPVFGGFLAGLTMPRVAGKPDADVIRQMEDMGNLLLPLFFVVTGLSLAIGPLDGDTFAILALVCALATVGKVGPAYAASRAAGLAPRDSAAVAVLVNTRGLTELIALNVGLTDGIINRRMFSVLVLMALVTTLGTAPVLSWFRLGVPAVPERVPAVHRAP
jgi:Kef-type K+ transport system membrane component KefB